MGVLRNLGAAIAAILTVACAGPSGGLAGRAEGPPPRPNVVLILADDLGYADLGFTGAADIPTPNIDLLAARGILCTDGHVSASVCAPSRAGMLTGRYQQRTGFECNLGRSGGLLEGTETFPAALRAAGYATTLVGKWHLGAEAHNHPMALGFDHFTGLLGGSRSYFPLVLAKAPGRVQRIERDGVAVPEEEFGYLTDFFTAEGERAIRGRDASRPFFLFMSYTAPHGPMHAREDLEARFRAIESPRRRKYAAMVSALDEGVGRLMRALDDEGIADETLVVFLSDNGGATGNASDNGPWRGMKGSKWEGGHRVPFVLRWPGRFAPGRYHETVSSLDLAATFLAAAGAPPARVADGVDLTPFLSGERPEARPHRSLFWRRAVASAAREGDWKLIRAETAPGVMGDPILVNLADDPGERVNRASAEPDRVERLLGLLSSWESAMSPPRWLTAEVWRENQRKKHRMDVIGRDAERRLP